LNRTPVRAKRLGGPYDGTGVARILYTVHTTTVFAREGASSKVHSGGRTSAITPWLTPCRQASEIPRHPQPLGDAQGRATAIGRLSSQNHLIFKGRCEALSSSRIEHSATISHRA